MGAGRAPVGQARAPGAASRLGGPAGRRARGEASQGGLAGEEARCAVGGMVGCGRNGDGRRLGHRG